MLFVCPKRSYLPTNLLLHLQTYLQAYPSYPIDLGSEVNSRLPWLASRRLQPQASLGIMVRCIRKLITPGDRTFPGHNVMASWGDSWWRDLHLERSHMRTLFHIITWQNRFSFLWWYPTALSQKRRARCVWKSKYPSFFGMWNALHF